MSTYEIVRACSIAMLGGVVLQASGVSAGRGKVIDWRTVKSGETIQDGGDAFDTAQLYVALVGVEAAMASVDLDVEPTPQPKVAPRVHAYMANHSGSRRRTFDATSHGFKVMVEPHEDDAAQARFTELLADAAESIEVASAP